MIVYSCIGLFDGRKRKISRRMSDKSKRVYAKLHKYRKMWWHFKIRWNPNTDELTEE